MPRPANALGELALNEEVKAKFCNAPTLRPFMRRVAAAATLPVILNPGGDEIPDGSTSVGLSDGPRPRVYMALFVRWRTDTDLG